MIRRARIEDASAIASLSGELGYPATDGQAGDRLRTILPQDDMAVFVAETDDAVVGWLHMVGCHRIEDDPFAEIGGLIVAESARSRGVGAELIEAGERWARAGGYRRVVVRSNVLRERAHRFYERVGYTRFKRQGVFEKTL